MLYLDFPFPLDLAADKLTKEKGGGGDMPRFRALALRDASWAIRESS